MKTSKYNLKWKVTEINVVYTGEQTRKSNLGMADEGASGRTSWRR